MAPAPPPPVHPWALRLMPALLLAAATPASCLPAAPAPAAPAYGPLDVRTFGAKGDGVADDAPAIQKAIDQAQQVSAIGTHGSGPSRPVYFPAGLYLVKTSLNVVSTHVNATSTGRLALSLRLYGDGVAQSIIMADAPMDAVLRFGGYGPDTHTTSVPGVTTNGHTVESMKFDAAGVANYSVAATAITRSLFRYSDFSGARIAGLLLGYGWINDVLECYFTGNLIGLYLDNAVNSVNCIDGNFEGNYGVGIIVNSGAMVRLEGNEFESQGGPGIIANGISALTVRSNYFEANNLGWPAGNNSKVISYGDHHSGREEQVCTDILLNGNPTWGPERAGGNCAPTCNPLVVAGPEGRLVLARIYLSNVDPCTGVVVSANSHSPGHDVCPSNRFSGTYAAGVVGLVAQASHAGGCSRGKRHYHYGEVVLTECVCSFPTHLICVPAAPALRPSILTSHALPTNRCGAGSCSGKNQEWTAIKSEASVGPPMMMTLKNNLPLSRAGALKTAL